MGVATVAYSSTSVVVGILIIVGKYIAVVIAVRVKESAYHSRQIPWPYSMTMGGAMPWLPS